MNMRNLTRESYARRIQRVLDTVAGSLDAPLRLEDLAAVAALSPWHFHRVFQAMVGESIGDVVRRLRLARAAWRLRTSRASVTEVALEAGYGSIEGFARAFRKASSLAPSAYRRSVPPPALKPANIRLLYAPESGSIRFISHAGDHGMDVTIETLPPRWAVCLRHVGPYDHVATAFRRLYAWAGPAGILGPGCDMLGLSYDDPATNAADRLRYDACLTVEAPVAVGDGMRIEQVLGGRHAVYLHRRCYAGMYDSFQRLVRLWLPDSGEEPDDRPCVEHYLNDIADTPEPALLTRLCIPLKD